MVGNEADEGSGRKEGEDSKERGEERVVSREQNGRRRRMGLSHGVRRAVLGEFRALRAARRGQLQRGKELFFPPSREFYLGAENSRNAGRAGAFGGGPSLSLTQNGFRLIQRRPNLKKRPRAPPGVAEEAAWDGTKRAPGGRRVLGPHGCALPGSASGQRGYGVMASTLDSESSGPSSSLSGAFTFRPCPVPSTPAARSFEGRVGPSPGPVRLPLQLAPIRHHWQRRSWPFPSIHRRIYFETFKGPSHRVKLSSTTKNTDLLKNVFCSESLKVAPWFFFLFCFATFPFDFCGDTVD